MEIYIAFLKRFFGKINDGKHIKAILSQRCKQQHSVNNSQSNLKIEVPIRRWHIAADIYLYIVYNFLMLSDFWNPNQIASCKHLQCLCCNDSYNGRNTKGNAVITLVSFWMTKFLRILIQKKNYSRHVFFTWICMYMVNFCVKGFNYFEVSCEYSKDILNILTAFMI